MRGKRRFGEGILVFVFLGVLCLALLAVVLLALSGESRRSRLALEHEAEEAAMALLRRSMAGVEAHDRQGLERRIAGLADTPRTEKPGVWAYSSVATDGNGTALAFISASLSAGMDGAGRRSQGSFW